MPPANSPNVRVGPQAAVDDVGNLTSAQVITTPPTLEPSTPFFEQLAEITSPAPDLASTLFLQAEQEVYESNLRFLRSRPSTPPQRYGNPISPPGSSSRVRGSMPSASEPDNIPPYPLWRGVRRARRQGDSTTEAHRQIPSWTTDWGDQHLTEADLYRGWAPGTVEDAMAYPDLRGADMSSAQLYNQWSSRMREIRSNRAGESDIDRRQELLRTAREMSRFHEQFEPPTISESAIRSTTRTLQPRQEPPPHRSTQHLERFIWDRERGLLGDEENLANHPTIEASRARQRALRAIEAEGSRPRPIESESRPTHPSVEAYRQHFLENPMSAAAEKQSLTFELMIATITRLCQDFVGASSKERKETMEPIHTILQVEPEDRIRDYSSLPPPPFSSWLHNSDSFSGAQQAPPLCSRHRAERSTARSSLRPPHPGRRTHVQQINPNYRSQDTPAPSSDQQEPTRSPTPESNDRIPQRWPVRVTLDHVDYPTMTLSGTMEAFNSIDDSPPPPGSTPTTPSLDDHAPASSSVKSFMQGEIIDFRTHTLESLNFRDAKPRTDAQYWRRLGPWKSMSDREISRSVCSRKWVEEELWGKWVLMRWKGTVAPFSLFTPNLSRYCYMCLK